MLEKSFFRQGTPDHNFLGEFRDLFLEIQLFFKDQTLMVFWCNWKVDSSVKKTLSKNPGTLNCLQKSSRLISCCWEIFETFFGIFFDTQECPMVCPGGHWMFVRFFEAIFNVCGWKKRISQSNLRNCLFGMQKISEGDLFLFFFQTFSIANSSNFSIYGS